MSSRKETLNFKAGVTLERVTLYNGSTPVAEGFNVRSKSTPEVKNFSTRAEAEKYFADEVFRCS